MDTAVAVAAVVVAETATTTTTTTSNTTNTNAADITDRPRPQPVVGSEKSLPLLDDELSTGAATTGLKQQQHTAADDVTTVADIAIMSHPSAQPSPQVDNVSADAAADVDVAAAKATINGHHKGDDRIDAAAAAAAADDEEKCDADPENSRKSCDITPDTSDEISLSAVDTPSPEAGDASTPPSTEAAAATADQPSASDDTEQSPSKSSMAFTIDFDDGARQVNSKKYNDIFERFQRRHQRGASMSKLEDGGTAREQAPAVVTAPTVRGKTPLRKAASTVTAPAAKTVVGDGKVRLRDKSRLSRRDGSCGPENRHSWSPRNSSVQPTQGRTTGEEAPPIVVQPMTTRLQQQRKLSADLLPSTTAPFQPKSATLQRAFETIKCNFDLNNHRTAVAVAASSNATCTSTSTTDLEIPCSAPPLEFRAASGSASSVSEAGTYTLDGDNYTEEQKEQMSIDKLAKLSLKTTETACTISPSAEQQPLQSPPLQPLPKPVKTKPTSYLERIKSKVRNISDRTFHPHQHHQHKQAVLDVVELPPQMSQYTKQQPPSTLDLGNFTSITSAGVFSKPAAMQQQQQSKHGRKPSLSKSQIDNAEYIQHAAASEGLQMCSFTDYEKARQNDYQLSMAPAVSPSGGLERAETKNDWIQEWAKNARRNTKKTAAAALSDGGVVQRPAAMAFEPTGGVSGGGTSTGGGTNANNSSSDYSDINQSSAAAHRRQMLVYHAHEANRYADDLQRYDRRSRQSASPARPRRAFPAASATPMTASTTSHSEFGDLDDDDDDDDHSAAMSSTSPHPPPHHDFYRVSRPPVSPSKIPSPMHSLARPRSSSMNRSLHSSITDLDSRHHNDDTGMYLHKTAAAISQLQNIHRQQNATGSSPQHSPASPQHGGKIASNFMTSPSVRRHYKHSPFAQLSPEHQQAAVAARPPHAVHASPTHVRSGYAHHGSSTSLHQQQYQQQQDVRTLQNLQHQQQHFQQQQQLHRNHRRNHSLDNSEPLASAGRSTVYRNEAMSHSYNSDGLREALHHSRHHSYENSDNDLNALRSPVARSRVHSIDQTFAPHIVKRTAVVGVVAPSRCDIANNSMSNGSSSSNKVRSKSANVTPATIKRSSSFSTKPFVRPQSGSSVPAKQMTPKAQPSRQAPALQKSASSNSFKNMSGRYGHTNGSGDGGIYLNDNDNLYAPNCSSESELSDALASPGGGAGPAQQQQAAEVLTNTRYNRAFLARLEQNKPKQATTGGAASSATSSVSGATPCKLGGAHACPNTPEMPRRDLRVRQSLRDRASMPRDSSIQRMKQDLGKKANVMDSPRALPASPATGGGGGRVLPKYLDISKYKPQQGNTFLRRDESKSTLNAQHKEIKRSTSSFGVGLGRSEAVGRSSVRSVKSATSGHSAGGSGRPTMVVNKDEATREADLAMWRRRASYDPMKAAAEGKRKMEEKKTAHANKFGDSSPAVVLRSQSYHSGVGQSAAASSNAGGDRTDAVANKRWTLISTESSEDDDQPQY